MKRITIATAIMAAAVASGALLAQSSGDPGTPAQTPQTQATPPSEEQPQQQPAARPAAPSSTNQAQPSGSPRIAPGSVIPVQLTKTIDAKKAKPGDEVVAKVTMDLKTTSGEVVVPKDTKVVGHVTEAQARSKEQKESQLAIAFDHAALKTGDMNLPMSIQAVIAPPSNNTNTGGANAAGTDQGGAPSAAGGTTSPTGGGRGSMGTSGQTQPPAAPTNSEPTAGSEGQQQSSNARPQITGNTKGVVGISNLTLSDGQNATQGSVLSSDKNNVKVESGTMLLLKVNQ